MDWFRDWEFFFRWLHVIAGLILFTMNYMYMPGAGFGPTSNFSLPGVGLTPKAIWILMGMTCGLIMWFNVWFIIWPSQKALLTGKVIGDAAAAVRKKAT